MCETDVNKDGPGARQRPEAGQERSSSFNNIYAFPEPQGQRWVRADREWFAAHKARRRAFRLRPVFAGEWFDLAATFRFDATRKAPHGFAFHVLVALPGVANPERIPVLEPDLGLKFFELDDCDAALAALHRSWAVAIDEGAGGICGDELVHRLSRLRKYCPCGGACVGRDPVKSVQSWLQNCLSKA